MEQHKYKQWINIISKELKEGEKFGIDNIYKRATAVSRQTEKWSNAKTEVKIIYCKLLFKSIYFMYDWYLDRLERLEQWGNMKKVGTGLHGLNMTYLLLWEE